MFHHFELLVWAVAKYDKLTDDHKNVLDNSLDITERLTNEVQLPDDASEEKIKTLEAHKRRLELQRQVNAIQKRTVDRLLDEALKIFECGGDLEAAVRALRVNLEMFHLLIADHYRDIHFAREFWNAEVHDRLRSFLSKLNLSVAP